MMLLLLRHGETLSNRQGLLLGRADPPLTDDPAPLARLKLPPVTDAYGPEIELKTPATIPP